MAMSRFWGMVLWFNAIARNTATSAMPTFRRVFWHVPCRAFQKDFSKGWNEAGLRALDECVRAGGDEDGLWEFDPPAEVSVTEYGFFIKPGDLSIFCDGKYYDDPNYGAEAFFGALDRLKVRFPGLDYDGYVGYSTGLIGEDSDDDEVWQWEVYENDEVWQWEVYENEEEKDRF